MNLAVGFWSKSPPTCGWICRQQLQVILSELFLYIIPHEYNNYSPDRKSEYIFSHLSLPVSFDVRWGDNKCIWCKYCFTEITWEVTRVSKIHQNLNNLTIILIIQHTEYIKSEAILMEYGKILCYNEAYAGNMQIFDD